MCNRYGLKTPISRIVTELARWELPLVKPGAHELPNLEPREHIRPTNSAPILRQVEGGLEMVERRWGMIPFFFRKHISEWKGLNTNCRGETAAELASFKGPFKARRCLVPASHFFEWTGPKGDKTMWRFTRTDADLFCFAGLWERASTMGQVVESFTILTSAPGPDAAKFHDRQPVIIEPQDWAAWLDPSQPAERLMQPPQAHGHLEIVQEPKGAVAA